MPAADVEPAGFQLLYEEGPCLVVHKPPGLLTQAPPGIDSLELRVRDFLRRREQRTGNFYLAVIHRLDRPASGALLMARHVRAARRLADQFRDRMIGKTYWAIVDGLFDQPHGTWRDYLRKLPGTARGEVCQPTDADAREAVLHFRALRPLAAQTLLEVRLETGRYHQIRVQSASRGHPVCGDAEYGSPTSFGPPAADQRDRWIALHARELTFRHPMSRAAVTVTAPLPAGWPDLERLP